MTTIGSKRMQHFSTGIFTELNEKRDAMEKQGKKLYNLFVGTPDFPPAPHPISSTFLFTNISFSLECSR